ncbi:class I SAM-dependent methyltransferase [Pseudomonas sp. S1Bt23]|jgi:SAM-dependent methyltransferase|uniref:class I SAM-dependent methyltransferase n=1 Tax=Pseudomonas sp. S1Bt23 TaxID=3095074 RepID=UPI002A59ADA3|nr:methyltransferase domain-containing protein [Pseudomonas sp. S1Bt23]WPO49538.1 methyltransferase domain-containing protein [Pseudomonas sp. S1Bt23]
MSSYISSELIELDGFQPLQISECTNFPKKIQYACGLNVLDEWLNVDFFDDALIWNFGHIGGVPKSIAEGVYKLNLLERHPFPDNHFDYAFCEDFIEHIHQKDAIFFLSEVLRTLKPGGVLRLSTPGLHGVMSLHFNRPDLNSVIENQDAAYTRWGHVHFFSHESLRTMALYLGFRKYRQRSYGKSWHKKLKNLETRAEQANYKINIYAELTK